MIIKCGFVVYYAHLHLPKSQFKLAYTGTIIEYPRISSLYYNRHSLFLRYNHKICSTKFVKIVYIYIYIFFNLIYVYYI